MQNQDLFGLTDDDRKKVQRAVDAVRPLGGPTGMLGGSPDIYVAKAPEGGIAALVPKGADDYDHPGFAVCQIYQIMPSNASGESWDLQPMSGMDVPVFNLSGIPIDEDCWMVVVRSKEGMWLCAGQLTPPAIPGTGTDSGENIGTGTGTGIGYEVVTIITGLRVDGVNLQVTTRDVHVYSLGEGSGWETIHEGTECPE
jgi:hypothetical protein